MFIRAAVDQDWPAICQVFKNAGIAAWGEIFSPSALEEIALNESWLAVIKAQSPEEGFVVAVDSGNVVGFAAFRADPLEPSVGEVALLYTEPSVWGRGFGHELLQYCERELRSMGFSSAKLWTEERNPARGFYDRQGWTLSGNKKERSMAGTDLVEFEYVKPLDYS